VIENDRYSLSPRIRCCAAFARGCPAHCVNGRPRDHREPAGCAVRSSAFGSSFRQRRNRKDFRRNFKCVT
jgi:hypothetical protein